MKPQQASVTATIMAFHRALEMLVPEKDRVCHDPLAIHFLPQDWVALMGEQETLMAFMEEKKKEFPGVNGAVVSRVRFIDDIVVESLEKGLEQLVILGAGYDSRAYRIHGSQQRVVVFEVDDPATQQDKLVKLQKALSETPSNVRFVPINFSTDSLTSRLGGYGYNPSKKTLFILEGLVPYLPIEAFESLLASIAGDEKAEHSIVFDYLPPDVIDGSSPLTEGRNMYREVKNHGERFRLGFERSQLEKFLLEKGFTVLQNINAPELKDRYFHGSSSDRPITPVFWFVHARTG